MEKFVLAITRTCGSGGTTIGSMLAKEYQIGLYDRQLMSLASEDSGISEALFASADESVKNTLLYKVSKKVYNGELIPPESGNFTSDNNLFNYQAKIIKELAEEESCIIIGRCADYILKDRKDLIRLFFYAPLEDCVERERIQSGGTEKDIIKKIQKIDKHRSEYYKYYTGEDWNDARNYDFCLNTSSMSYEQLIQVVKNYIDVFKA